MIKYKAVMNWSGGKDSAMSLYKVLKEKRFNVNTLITTLSSAYRRISMHGVKEELLDMQAKAVGFPLIKVRIPAEATMEIYDDCMQKAMSGIVKQNIFVSIFGDIFLEDLRQYREERLAIMNMRGDFPLWKKDTTSLVREFVGLGFKSVIVCVNEKHLDKSFLGREINNDFINDLPENVDPCGENGEYHSFVYDGPIFKNPVIFKKGQVVYKKYSAPNDKSDSIHPQDNLTDNLNDNHRLYDTGFWYLDLEIVNNNN